MTGPDGPAGGLDPSWYCRTCRRGLYVRDTPAGPRYLHAQAMRGGGEVDHAPDPAPLAEVPDAIQECDFCSALAVFVYACGDQDTDRAVITSRTVSAQDYRERHHAARTRRVQTDGYRTDRWGERWTACPDCAACLDGRDLMGLIRRATDAFPARVTRGRKLQAVRGELHTVYTNIFATLAPGRGRILPGQPLGVWEPTDADPPGDREEQSALDGQSQP
jgi:hypothetical protein